MCVYIHIKEHCLQGGDEKAKQRMKCLLRKYQAPANRKGARIHLLQILKRESILLSCDKGWVHSVWERGQSACRTCS